MKAATLAIAAGALHWTRAVRHDERLRPGTRSVPDTLFVDRPATGFDGSRDIRAWQPRIEALARDGDPPGTRGVDAPILLSTDLGYSGEESSAQVCHQSQHRDLVADEPRVRVRDVGRTRHQTAIDECLCRAIRSASRNAPGGFDPRQARQEHLEGVQCENCHGRGGPHQSPDFLAERLRGRLPRSCHDAGRTHCASTFADRLPLVSHAANLQFATPVARRAQRRELVARRDKRDRTAVR